MHEITLQAEIRKQVSKGLFALRNEGKVPGVYYVTGEPNLAIAVTAKNLKPLVYTSETHIVSLQLGDGVTKRCIIRDIQFDPISDRPIHFDLLGLREDRKITIEVPIVVTGTTPLGVRDGGILNHFLHKVKISCLPKDIPEHIEINCTDLKVNHFVHVGDLKLENVTIIGNPTNAVVGILPPTVEKEVVAGAAEEAAEPEVITKGKKVDEEGAEGDKKADGGKAAAPAKK